MECETYRVKDSQKTDRTVFTLTLNPDKSQLLYRKASGPDWMIPDGTKLDVIWKSKDQLRCVAKWIDTRYEGDEKVWHPVFIFDVDFSKPRFSGKPVGGFADFDEIVEDPWKYEYRRLD